MAYSEYGALTQIGDYAILRGMEVLVRGLTDYKEAVLLAEELVYTNHIPLRREGSGGRGRKT